MHQVAASFEPFVARPRQAALLLDLDGTVAPIVLDPALARPLPGAAEVLLALRERFGEVAVVSGRPVAFLAEHLPPSITLSGLYGLEQRREGRTVEHPLAAGWRTRVAEVVAAAASAPAGVEVEDKGLSLTLHFRRHPEVAGPAGAWAQAAARRAGLEVRRAKMSLELHPPVALDKGIVVEELVGDLPLACYIGDDEGDLAAFDALDRLTARGCTTVRVGVVNDEASAALLARADLRVDGPEGVLDLLRSLL